MLRPLTPETFGQFSEAAYDDAESRIHNGAHWECDAMTGIGQGRRAARHVIGHAFKRPGGSQGQNSTWPPKASTISTETRQTMTTIDRTQRSAM